MGCGWRATTAADTLHRETREKMVGGWRIVPFVRLIHHHAVLSTRLPVADSNWNSCSCGKWFYMDAKILHQTH
jgi:hypothetical protein